ncbi:MAG: AAA family ATPase [Erysipelotrichaceae bacterium]
MIPLKLSFQGFGPYVKQQNIDFDELRKNKLFLIYGETGAGKTIILDAMSYALYGKSSGSMRGDFETMRCRYAPADLPTEISFTFSVDNHIYCFKRSIKVAHNRKGEVVFHTAIDAGEIIQEEFVPFYENPKLRNIEEKAISLLHLTHDQFSSVIMLPQGQFEKFLIADSESKQAILKTLFAVEDYEGYASVLNEKVKEMKQQVDELELRKEIALQSIGLNQIEAMIDLKASLSLTMNEKKIELEEDKVQLNKLEENLTIQKQVHETKQRLKLAIDALKIHEEKRVQRDQEEQELNELKAKQHKLPLLKQYKTLSEKLKDDKTNYLKAKLSYEGKIEKEKELLKQQDLYDHKLIGFDALTLLIHKMEDSKPNVKQYQLVLNEFETVQTKYKECCRLIEKQANELKKDEASRLVLLSRLKTIETSEKILLNDTKEIILLEQGKKWNETYYDTNQQIQELNQEIENDQATLVKEQKIYEQTIIAHEAAYQEYLDNSIISLSKLLVEGEACPVCGATHHPLTHIEKQLHEVKDLNQLKEDKDQAYKNVTSLEMNLEAERKKIILLKDNAENIHQQILTLLVGEYNSNYHQEVSNRYNEHIKIVANKDEILKEQASLEENYLRLQNLNKESVIEQQKISEQLAILKSQKTSLEKQLYEHISDLFTLDSQIKVKIKEQKTLKDEMDAYAVLKNEIKIENEKAFVLIENLDKQIKEKEKEQRELYIELKQDIPKTCQSVEEWLTHINVYDELVTKEKMIRKYDDETLRLSTIINQNKDKLNGIPFEDIKLLETNLNDLKIAYEEKSKELRIIETKLEQCQSVEITIQDCILKKHELVPKLSKLTDFTKAIRGDNGVGLQRYVLGIMLSNITASANQLLCYVHNGRYRIHRSDFSSGRIRKAGLELSIYDAYSGSDRSVLSLSGGEKFLVSLALSLALSTSIQSHNGGVCIQAMFIDEGFGSLDENSIDDALLVLSSITHGKGMIGIISHVEQLKSNIETAIEVCKTSDGSYLHFHSGE